MKKFLALTIVLAFMALLAGCNDIKPNSNETTPNPSETSIPTETGETEDTDETDSPDTEVPETEAPETEPAVEVSDTPLKETDTIAVFKSILKNERHIYCPSTNESILLSEYTQDTDLSINNYSIIDLNDDNVSEMVLWVTHATLGDYAAAILYYEKDTVYAHAIAHRGFNSLKQDGTFHFSGGASNQGTGRIDFSGDTYTKTKVAYCQSEANNTVSYFIEDTPVSREEFSAYQEAQRAKPDAERIKYNDGTVNGSDEFITYSTITADQFFDLIWNLKENGTIPLEPYDVEITSIPAVMHMAGDANLASIEAMGQIVSLTDRNSPDTTNFVYLCGDSGEKELFQCYGKLIFVDTYYGVGNTYIIDSDGYDVLRNNGSTSTNLYLDDKGELRYKTVHSGMADMVVSGRLTWAIGYDDFYMEEGQANFRGGELMLMRDSYLSMSDGYGLDKEFNKIYKDKYASIEEVFEENKKKFADLVTPIYIPADGGVYGMIDHLRYLADRKELPRCPYDIYVTGLSVPLVIHMAGGQSILSVEAYGTVQDMTSPDYRAVLYDGSTLPRVFEVGENVVFNLSSGSYGGTTYIFSKYGCSLVKSGSQSSVYLFLDESGNLKYRFSTRRTSGIQQGFLWEIVSFDEFYYSIGDAEIVNGEAILSVPYEVYTVSDAFDGLDTMFDKDIYQGFETVEDLFAANLKVELDYRATTFSPEKYVADVNIHTGKEVLFWHKIGFNPVYLYFVPIENSANEFTVYYTNNYGISLDSLKLDLPTDITFDTAELVWADGGGGSGECRFVVKLTNGDDVAYIYYNNFHYETDILDFRYAGTVPTEDLEYFMETYPEIFGEIE